MIIVVARYNENIEWTKEFPNVICYNKGVSLDTEYKEVLLENVGREGHTYYRYICDNYDNLEDYTIFLQGNPFDHRENIIHDIKKYMEQNDVNKLHLGFEILTDYILECNLTDCERQPGLPLKEIYEKLFTGGKEFTENETFTVNTLFPFGAGAQFIVSKEQILKRPREFYLEIVKLLEYDIHPVEGFVIERFHHLIFSA